MKFGMDERNSKKNFRCKLGSNRMCIFMSFPADSLQQRNKTALTVCVFLNLPISMIEIWL